MRVFLTGASGWIGSAVAHELIDAGHSVTGLVRTKEKGQKLADMGVTPLMGTLTDLDTLRRGVGEADGVIHTAFGLDFSDYDTLSQEDRAAIHAFADAFKGSERPIIVTSGLGRLHSAGPFTEEARPAVIPEYPRMSEQTAFALAERGVVASVVRPARAVHGIGERHGFIPMLASIARERGVSAYVGEGLSPWPAAHRLDVARVYRHALERGIGNEAYHAVAEEVPFRLIAEAIGRHMGVPALSVSHEDAEAHFGGLAFWMTGTGSVSSQWTRQTLGWEPREMTLVADIDRPEYYD